MSLNGMMRTSVSGMAAQANRLSTVADNIANSSTNGYKRARTDFSTLVIPNSPGAYASGGVKTSVSYAISQQGTLQYTTSGTDLAVNGNGFFVVQGSNGTPYLTRAGSFVPDSQGRLINAAGYYLMGYPYTSGTPAAVANGFAGLEPITISQDSLISAPSTFGTFTANLPEGADIVVPANLPSANAGTAQYSAKSSVVTYDNLGGEVLLDIYFTKTGANTWEVAVYNQADAAPGTGFPYASAALATETLDFDGTTGQLDALSADSITLTVPNGASFELDLSAMTQLSGDYTLFDVEANGSPPVAIEQIVISDDGIVAAQFEDGSLKPLYRVALATARSPDMLQPLPGNVYAQTQDSGDIRIGFPTEGDMGAVLSGALEQSNADVATELTSMIEAQRNYTANSKVFQTGSELMDILVNLKR